MSRICNWAGIRTTFSCAASCLLKEKENLDLVKHLEVQLDKINAALPGDWKEGRVGKDVIRKRPLFDRRTFGSAEQLSQCNDAKSDETISWAIENVPKSEQLMIEICNEFFEKNSH